MGGRQRGAHVHGLHNGAGRSPSLRLRLLFAQHQATVDAASSQDSRRRRPAVRFLLQPAARLRVPGSLSELQLHEGKPVGRSRLRRVYVSRRTAGVRGDRQQFLVPDRVQERLLLPGDVHRAAVDARLRDGPLAGDDASSTSRRRGRAGQALDGDPRPPAGARRQRHRCSRHHHCRFHRLSDADPAAETDAGANGHRGDGLRTGVLLRRKAGRLSGRLQLVRQLRHLRRLRAALSSHPAQRRAWTQTQSPAQPTSESTRRGYQGPHDGVRRGRGYYDAWLWWKKDDDRRRIANRKCVVSRPRHRQSGLVGGPDWRRLL